MQVLQVNNLDTQLRGSCQISQANFDTLYYQNPDSQPYFTLPGISHGQEKHPSHSWDSICASNRHFSRVNLVDTSRNRADILHDRLESYCV